MMTTTPPLILASNSPRRKQLLTEAGFSFEVRPTNVDEENYPADLPVSEVPVFLAERKARALSQFTATAVVLAADTVVILDNQIIGKPIDAADACLMLQKLSGRKHLVVSGVAILFQSKIQTFSVHTDVYFHELTESDITHYVHTFQPFDKAGAYGIQEWIGYIGVEKIDGDFYNVMGLPIAEVRRRLMTIS